MMFGRYLNFVTLWPITCAFLRTKVQKRRSSRVLHLSFQRDVRTEQRARTRRVVQEARDVVPDRARYWHLH